MSAPAPAPFGLPLGRREWLRLAAGLAGLGLLAFLAFRLAADWQALPREALRAFHLDPRPLAAAWLLQTLGWLLVGDAWRRMLGAAGASPLPLARHLQLHTLAALTFVVPGSIWAPLSRVALYRRFGVGGLIVAAATLIELLLLGVAGLLLFGLAAPFMHGLAPAWALLLVPLALAGLLLLHPAAMQGALRTLGRWLGQQAEPPRAAWGDILGWFGRELAVLGLSGIALYLLMAGISPAAALPDALAAWGLSVAVASLLAWMPATAFLKDGGMVLVLSPLYLEATGDAGTAALVALGVTLAWRIWTALVLLSWAALASWRAGRLAP